MRYKNKKRQLRHCVSITLSFILSLTLTCCFILTILNQTVLNQNYFKQQLKQSNFTQYKISEMEDIFVSLGLASNFSEDFMISVIDKEQIEKNINSTVDYIYSDANFSINEDELRENYHNLFLQNAKERGFEITTENEEAINFLANECVQAYKETVSFSKVSIIKSYLPKFDLLANFILITVIVLSVITILLLILLNKTRIYNALKYLNYSLITSFLFLIIPTLTVLFSKRIEKLGILNEALYKFATTYLNNLLQYTLIFSIVILLICIVIYFIFIKMYRKKHMQ